MAIEVGNVFEGRVTCVKPVSYTHLAAFWCGAAGVPELRRRVQRRRGAAVVHGVDSPDPPPQCPQRDAQHPGGAKGCLLYTS